MSISGRALQGFAGLVAVATTPLAIFSTQKSSVEIQSYQNNLTVAGGAKISRLNNKWYKKWKKYWKKMLKKQKIKENMDILH
ncbi:hypothetical protein [Mycoplasma ovis]|nr:hypothetical protein [Mycoplasma ovis]